jgi:hypothetical protein
MTTKKQSSKEVEVEFYPSEGGLNEIYQQTGFHFAFVSSPKEGSKQCHKLVKCRDFLHDAVRAKHQGNSCSIFSFNYNANTDPAIDMRRMRMLVQKPDLKPEEAKDFEEKMRNGLKLLNHYEKMAKVSLSKLYKVKAKDKNDRVKKEAWLFIGPVFWMKSPYLTSMYTYLIRLGDKKFEFTDHKSLVKDMERIMEEFKAAGKGDNDIEYLSVCKDTMDKVVKKAGQLLFRGEKVDPILDSKVGIGSYHNRGGIYSLCSGHPVDKEIGFEMAKLKEK